MDSEVIVSLVENLLVDGEGEDVNSVTIRYQ